MVKNTFNLGVILLFFGLLGFVLYFPLRSDSGYFSILTMANVSLQSGVNP